MKTADEILTKHLEACKITLNTATEKYALTNAMEEYAQQFNAGTASVTSFAEALKQLCRKHINGHNVTADGFNGYKVGETIHGIHNGIIHPVVLREDTVLNSTYYWLTPLEFTSMQQYFGKHITSKSYASVKELTAESLHSILCRIIPGYIDISETVCGFIEQAVHEYNEQPATQLDTKRADKIYPKGTIIHLVFRLNSGLTGNIKLPTRQSVFITTTKSRTGVGMLDVMRETTNSYPDYTPIFSAIY